MVVLVRCNDNTFAPALESRLNDLISRGLISAFLSNGTWIEVAQKLEEEFEPAASKRHMPRLPMAACF